MIPSMTERPIPHYTARRSMLDRRDSCLQAHSQLHYLEETSGQTQELHRKIYFLLQSFASVAREAGVILKICRSLPATCRLHQINSKHRPKSHNNLAPFSTPGTPTFRIRTHQRLFLGSRHIHPVQPQSPQLFPFQIPSQQQEQTSFKEWYCVICTSATCGSVIKCRNTPFFEDSCPRRLPFR